MDLGWSAGTVKVQPGLQLSKTGTATGSGGSGTVQQQQQGGPKLGLQLVRAHTQQDHSPREMMMVAAMMTADENVNENEQQTRGKMGHGGRRGFAVACPSNAGLAPR